jgi:hypothetical protein
MQWEHGDAPRLIAAGTTNGTLHVVRLVVVPAGDHDRLAEQQLRLEDVLMIEAHRPVAGRRTCSSARSACSPRSGRSRGLPTMG